MRIYRIILPLFLIILPWELNGATNAIQELQQYFNSVHSLSGRFIQEIRTESGRLIERSSGEFALARPNRFDWVYETPYRQRIVADGQYLWIYDVALQQVIVRPLDEVLGVGPALLLSGRFSDLRRSFELQNLGSGWIRLQPKSDQQWGFQKLLLHIAQGVPDVIKIHDALGRTMRLELYDLKRNPEFGPQRFQFTPPEGVDVIGRTREAAALQ